jgi:hypothetical protein
VSEHTPAARLHAIGAALAPRAPAVLAAMITLLETVLAAADRHRTERTPTAPVALTAAPVALTSAQVLEAARARGVPAFGEPAGDRLILLGSLGLDLTEPALRAALVDLHRRGEIRLATISQLDAVRDDLAARGLRAEFVDASALADGDTTYHAIAIK